eukprot:7986969-Pyramimonas_sp.AAC.1
MGSVSRRSAVGQTTAGAALGERRPCTAPLCGLSSGAARTRCGAQLFAVRTGVRGAMRRAEDRQCFEGRQHGTGEITRHRERYRLDLSQDVL